MNGPSLRPTVVTAQRFIAVVLSVSLLFTQVLFANNPEKSIWDQRRKSIEGQKQTVSKPNVLLAQLTGGIPLSQTGLRSSVVPTPSIIKKLKVDSASASLVYPSLTSLVSLISADGTIRDINVASMSTKNPTTVIYIQDIHGHGEAQKNIASMILKILDAHPNAVVGLEGSAGDFPMERYRGPSLDLNREVGLFFLDAGLITGAEHAGFGAKTLPTFYGVEDTDLYIKNVTAIKQATPLQKENLSRIEKETTQLQLRKPIVYTADMLSLDQKWRGFQDGTVGIGDYITHLTSNRSVSLSRFPNIGLFLKTWSLEKSLDFGKAERERGQFLTRLVEKLNKPELDRLIEQSVALRSGAIGYPDYHRLIIETASKAGLSLSETPEFDRYISYVLQADAVQPGALLSEISDYEAAVWNGLCTNEEQRRIYGESVRLSLTEKLVRLMLTPAEWDQYKGVRCAWCVVRGSRKIINDLPCTTHHAQRTTNVVSPFESFYESAEARNATLASNLKKKLSTSQSPVAILIAGGFHSDGLKQLLAKDDITFVTVSPKLTNVSNSRDNDYLTVFTREKTPLEKLFESPKISIVRTNATHPIPGMGVEPLDVSKGLRAVELRRAVAAGELTHKQIGKEIYAIANGNEEQMLELQRTFGWLVLGDQRNGRKTYRYTEAHPWGRPGAVVQPLSRIRFAAIREWWLAVPVLIPTATAVTSTYLLGATMTTQFIVALITSLASLLIAALIYNWWHSSTHNDAGPSKIQFAAAIIGVLSLAALLVVYATGGDQPDIAQALTRVIKGVLLGGGIFTVFHHLQDRIAAANPAIAPLSGGGSKERRPRKDTFEITDEDSARFIKLINELIDKLGSRNAVSQRAGLHNATLVQVLAGQRRFKRRTLDALRALGARFSATNASDQPRGAEGQEVGSQPWHELQKLVLGLPPVLEHPVSERLLDYVKNVVLPRMAASVASVPVTTDLTGHHGEVRPSEQEKTPDGGSSDPGFEKPASGSVAPGMIAAAWGWLFRLLEPRLGQRLAFLVTALIASVVEGGLTGCVAFATGNNLWAGIFTGLAIAFAHVIGGVAVPDASGKGLDVVNADKMRLLKGQDHDKETLKYVEARYGMAMLIALTSLLPFFYQPSAASVWGSMAAAIAPHLAGNFVCAVILILILIYSSQADKGKRKHRAPMRTPSVRERKEFAAQLAGGVAAGLAIAFMDVPRERPTPSTVRGRLIWRFELHDWESMEGYVKELETARKTHPKAIAAIERGDLRFFEIKENHPALARKLLEPGAFEKPEILAELRKIHDDSFSNTIEDEIKKVRDQLRAGVPEDRIRTTPEIIYLAKHPDVDYFEERAPFESFVAQLQFQILNDKAIFALYRDRNRKEFLRLHSLFEKTRAHSYDVRDRAFARRVEKALRDSPGAAVIVYRGYDHFGVTKFVPEIPGVDVEVKVREGLTPSQTGEKYAMRYHPRLMFSGALSASRFSFEERERMAVEIIDRLTDDDIEKLTKVLQENHAKTPETANDPVKLFGALSVTLLRWLHKNGHVGDDVMARVRVLLLMFPEPMKAPGAGLSAVSTQNAAVKAGHRRYSFYTDVIFTPRHEFLKIIRWMVPSRAIWREFRREHPGGFLKTAFRVGGLFFIAALTLAPPIFVGLWIVPFLVSDPLLHIALSALFALYWYGALAFGLILSFAASRTVELPTDQLSPDPTLAMLLEPARSWTSELFFVLPDGQASRLQGRVLLPLAWAAVVHGFVNIFGHIINATLSSDPKSDPTAGIRTGSASRRSSFALDMETGAWAGHEVWVSHEFSDAFLRAPASDRAVVARRISKMESLFAMSAPTGRDLNRIVQPGMWHAVLSLVVPDGDGIFHIQVGSKFRIFFHWDIDTARDVRNLKFLGVVSADKAKMPDTVQRMKNIASQDDHFVKATEADPAVTSMFQPATRSTGNRSQEEHPEEDLSDLFARLADVPSLEDANNLATTVLRERHADLRTALGTLDDRLNDADNPISEGDLTTGRKAAEENLTRLSNAALAEKHPDFGMIGSIWGLSTVLLPETAEVIKSRFLTWCGNNASGRDAAFSAFTGAARANGTPDKNFFRKPRDVAAGSGPRVRSREDRNKQPPKKPEQVKKVKKPAAPPAIVPSSPPAPLPTVLPTSADDYARQIKEVHKGPGKSAYQAQRNRLSDLVKRTPWQEVVQHVHIILSGHADLGTYTEALLAIPQGSERSSDRDHMVRLLFLLDQWGIDPDLASLDFVPEWAPRAQDEPLGLYLARSVMDLREKVIERVRQSAPEAYRAFSIRCRELGLPDVDRVIANVVSEYDFVRKKNRLVMNSDSGPEVNITEALARVLHASGDVSIKMARAYLSPDIKGEPTFGLMVVTANAMMKEPVIGDLLRHLTVLERENGVFRKLAEATVVAEWALVAVGSPHDRLPLPRGEDEAHLEMPYVFIGLDHTAPAYLYRIARSKRKAVFIVSNPQARKTLTETVDVMGIRQQVKVLDSSSGETFLKTHTGTVFGVLLGPTEENAADTTFDLLPSLTNAVVAGGAISIVESWTLSKGPSIGMLELIRTERNFRAALEDEIPGWPRSSAYNDDGTLTPVTQLTPWAGKELITVYTKPVDRRTDHANEPPADSPVSAAAPDWTERRRAQLASRVEVEFANSYPLLYEQVQPLILAAGMTETATLISCLFYWTFDGRALESQQIPAAWRYAISQVPRLRESLMAYIMNLMPDDSDRLISLYTSTVESHEANTRFTDEIIRLASEHAPFQPYVQALWELAERSTAFKDILVEYFALWSAQPRSEDFVGLNHFLPLGDETSAGPYVVMGAGTESAQWMRSATLPSVQRPVVFVEELESARNLIQTMARALDVEDRIVVVASLDELEARYPAGFIGDLLIRPLNATTANPSPQTFVRLQRLVHPTGHIHVIEPAPKSGESGAELVKSANLNLRPWLRARRYMIENDRFGLHGPEVDADAVMRNVVVHGKGFRDMWRRYYGKRAFLRSLALFVFVVCALALVAEILYSLIMILIGLIALIQPPLSKAVENRVTASANGAPAENVPSQKGGFWFNIPGYDKVAYLSELILARVAPVALVLWSLGGLDSVSILWSVGLCTIVYGVFRLPHLMRAFDFTGSEKFFDAKRGWDATFNNPDVRLLSWLTAISTTPLLLLPWAPVAALIVYGLALIILMYIHYRVDQTASALKAGSARTKTNSLRDITDEADARQAEQTNTNAEVAKFIDSFIGPIHDNLLAEGFDFEGTRRILYRRLNDQLRTVQKESDLASADQLRPLLYNVAYVAGLAGLSRARTNAILTGLLAHLDSESAQPRFFFEWLRGQVVRWATKAKILLAPMRFLIDWITHLRSTRVTFVHVDAFVRQDPSGDAAYNETADYFERMLKGSGSKKRHVLMVRYIEGVDKLDDMEQRVFENLRTVAEKRGLGDLMTKFLDQKPVVVVQPMALIKPTEVLAAARKHKHWKPADSVWPTYFSATPDQFYLADALAKFLYSLSGARFVPVVDQVENAKVLSTNA